MPNETKQQLDESLVIRPATVSDAESIVTRLKSESKAYLQRFHPFPLDTDDLKRRIGSMQRDRMFLLESASDVQLLGFMLLRGRDEGFSEYMLGLYVASNCARRGFGRLLIQYAITHCRMLHESHLDLKVYPDYFAAIRLYESMGFERIGEVDEQIRMRRSLVGPSAECA